MLLDTVKKITEEADEMREIINGQAEEALKKTNFISFLFD
jgi:hypothetical protein